MCLIFKKNKANSDKSGLKICLTTRPCLFSAKGLTPSNLRFRTSVKNRSNFYLQHLRVIQTEQFSKRVFFQWKVEGALSYGISYKLGENSNRTYVRYVTFYAIHFGSRTRTRKTALNEATLFYTCFFKIFMVIVFCCCKIILLVRILLRS